VTKFITQKYNKSPNKIHNQKPKVHNKGNKAHNQKPKTHNKGEGVYKVALLIPSNHMVNLLLYHHCIWDFLLLVVMSFFKEGHVPSSFTPRSETKDQPMPQA
jgi:hypothetical protein